MTALPVGGAMRVKMNRRKLALLVVGAVAMSGSTNLPANAGAAQRHKIRHVVLDAGNLGKTLSKGYSTIEQTTIHCNSRVGCTFAMRIMANVGQATCKGEWAIVGLVNGTKVDGGPLVEALPSAGNTQSYVWQGIYKTNSYYNTVAFELHLPCSANANQWSVRYMITEP